MILSTKQDLTCVSMKIIKWLMDPHVILMDMTKFGLATNQTTIFQHMTKVFFSKITKAWLYPDLASYGQILAWLVRACIQTTPNMMSSCICLRKGSTGHLYRGPKTGRLCHWPARRKVEQPTTISPIGPSGYHVQSGSSPF
jgi:hypothetical protein